MCFFNLFFMGNSFIVDGSIGQFPQEEIGLTSPIFLWNQMLKGFFHFQIFKGTKAESSPKYLNSFDSFIQESFFVSAQNCVTYSIEIFANSSVLFSCSLIVPNIVGPVNPFEQLLSGIKQISLLKANLKIKLNTNFYK